MNSIEKMLIIQDFNKNLSYIVHTVSQYCIIIDSILSKYKKKYPLVVFDYKGYSLKRIESILYIVSNGKTFPFDIKEIGMQSRDFDYMNLEEIFAFAKIAPEFLLHFIKILLS